jgi:hypothetical protein
MVVANRHPADYGENRGRGKLSQWITRLSSHAFVAIACEVLARRVVHNSPTDRIPAILSSRYMHRQTDGDIEFISAIELAIDSHW